MAALFQGANLDDMKLEWAVALHGFQPQEIERGLDRASEFEWQLTLPAFKLLCRPCLNPEFAWYEAQACLKQRDAGEVGDWTHPAVWRAAQRMSHEVRSGEAFTRYRTRWTLTLEGELSRGWGDIPAPLVQLPAKAAAQPAPCPPDIRARLDELRADMRLAIKRREVEEALRNTEPAPLEEPKP